VSYGGTEFEAAALGLFGKFKLLSFASLGQPGLPMGKLDICDHLAGCAIVIGLQAVGVVLMSAMLVAPAAAARQWLDRTRLWCCFLSYSVLAGCWRSISSIAAFTGPCSAVRRGGVFFSCFCPQSRPDLELGSPALTGASCIWDLCCDLSTPGGQHADPDHAHSLQAWRPSAPGGGVRVSLQALGFANLWFAAPGQTNGRSPCWQLKLGASCMI
jgi:manganese/zinc/iron transport system permease protein